MVPKRRPPSPHSCSRSRSPLRQCAAAKPSQVMKTNSARKMMKAVQSTFCTALLPVSPRYFAAFFLMSGTGPGVISALIVGYKVDDCGQDGSDDDPKKLVPIEERQADQGWLGSVVEWRPEHCDELNEKEQVPPAPSCAFADLSFHVSSQEEVAAC